MIDNEVKTLAEVQASRPKVNEDLIAKGATILQKYKDAKSNLETRIIDNDTWYRMRYEEIQSGESNKSTAWLFNSLANKHADAMDNYPEPIILPREVSDKQEAETLSQVLPVILERTGFEKTYSDVWWQKLKCGTGVYGVFWNPGLINGLGDIEIKKIDLLNLFWEPGVTDIQNSANVFYVKLHNNELLESLYPQLKGKLGQSILQVSHYIHDDNIDTSEKTPVVDWYYKRKKDNKTVLHYCKFCNGTLLYASENDPKYAERGFYDHGKYPFVFDVLYPMEDSPCGLGHIDIMKGAQEQIDSLDNAIIKNASRASESRFFINNSGSVNEKEFADWTKNFVHVSGSNLGEDSIRAINVPALPGIYLDVLTRKVEELKETSGNRDFSQGATTSGVTAASAIAALQEAGGKLTRDMVQQGYYAFSSVNGLVIEEIRQFYTEQRFFRITGPNGQDEFISFDNSQIKGQESSIPGSGEVSTRLPVFDIKVKSAKNSSYSKMSQNEFALQLYQLGMFNPANADVSRAAVEMMDFDGKQQVMNKIEENGSMYQKLQALIPLAIKCAQIVDKTQGTNGEITQQITSIIGNVPGGVNPSAVEVEKDNSLEAQARQRSNEATQPK